MKSREVKSLNPFEGQIGEQRQLVYDRLLSRGIKPNFTDLKNSDLVEVYRTYDEIFFGGQISQKVASLGANTYLDFDVSPSATAKYGGVCKTRYVPLTQGSKSIATDLNKGYSCHYTLAFPSLLYSKIFTQGETRLANAGMTCESRLVCLMLTFEHELVHLLMGLYGYSDQYQKSKSAPGSRKLNNFSAHGPLFRCFLNTVFGHTEFKHGLLNGEFDEVAAALTVKDFSVGDYVTVKGNPTVFQITQRKLKLLGAVDVATGRGWNLRPAGLTKTTAPPPSAGISGFSFVKPSGELAPLGFRKPSSPTVKRAFSVGDIIQFPGQTEKYELLQKRIKKWSAKRISDSQLFLLGGVEEQAVLVGKSQTKIVQISDFRVGEKIRWSGYPGDLVIKTITRGKLQAYTLDGTKGWNLLPFQVTKV